MNQNRILGMICSYYLSRFDEVAYKRLGYSTQAKAHIALGDSLRVPPKSIQNWRDEFDPIHPNRRQGWHKRSMAPSRVRVIEALSHLSEEELYEIVSCVHVEPNSPVASDLVEAINLSDSIDSEGFSSSRGSTGIAAENAFKSYFATNLQPVSGKLVDCRNDGCGYDFRIETASVTIAIEVKGMVDETSGITLTNKEWEIASQMLDCYYIAIVRNATSKPLVSFIQNPTKCLSPSMHVYTQVQINWSVPNSQLLSATS